jgi:hypothetical protein
MKVTGRRTAALPMIAASRMPGLCWGRRSHSGWGSRVSCGASCVFRASDVVIARRAGRKAMAAAFLPAAAGQAARPRRLCVCCAHPTGAYDASVCPRRDGGPATVGEPRVDAYSGPRRAVTADQRRAPAPSSASRIACSPTAPSPHGTAAPAGGADHAPLARSASDACSQRSSSLPTTNSASNERPDAPTRRRAADRLSALGARSELHLPSVTCPALQVDVEVAGTPQPPPEGGHIPRSAREPVHHVRRLNNQSERQRAAGFCQCVPGLRPSVTPSATR